MYTPNGIPPGRIQAKPDSSPELRRVLASAGAKKRRHHFPLPSTRLPMVPGARRGQNHARLHPRVPEMSIETSNASQTFGFSWHGERLAPASALRQLPIGRCSPLKTMLTSVARIHELHAKGRSNSQPAGYQFLRNYLSVTGNTPSSETGIAPLLSPKGYWRKHPCV